MNDVTRQLQEFCTGLDSSQMPIEHDDITTEPATDSPVRPVVDRPPVRYWRPAWAAGLAAAAVLLLGGVIWLLGIGGDSPPIADDAPTTTTIAPGDSPVEGSSGLLDAMWALETTLDGWLRPVPFSGGYAAIHREDPMSEVFAETDGDGSGPGPSDLFTGDVSVGDIWVSLDGISWARAAEQPPAQAWSLAGDGTTLFAEVGNVFDGTGEIWATTTGDEWLLALAPGEYGRLFESHHRMQGWKFIAGTVTAGPPGAVVFGENSGGAVAGWFFDGDRFVPADVGDIEGLPADAGWFAVTPLHDRFVLSTIDETTYESPQHRKLSYSPTGAVWDDLQPKPVGSPLAATGTLITETASGDGSTVASMDAGFGLWTTADGIAWTEIALRPSSNGWTPEVEYGGLGWLVYSPARSETAYSGGPDARNLGLWLSRDADQWFDLDEIGPLGSGGPRTFIVRDDHVLVFIGADRGPEQGWGVPGDPVTEVWRLDVVALADRSMLSVSLDAVERLEDFVLVARLHRAEGDRDPLGQTHYFGSVQDFSNSFVSGLAPIGVSPFSGSDVIRPLPDGPGEEPPSSHEILDLGSGNYRLVFEARVPQSVALYGCELPITVAADQSLVVTITELPDFAGDGVWTPDDQMRYPPCNE